MLESNIAAFAAKMATRADIDNLRRILEQEQRAIAMNDTSQDNSKMFHLVLAGASQNQMLLATVESIWHHMDSSPLWQQFNVHIASRPYRLKWLGDRQTLLAALRRRDVMGAWQAMWQHLENVKKSLLELSDEDAPDFDGYLLNPCRFFRKITVTIVPLYDVPHHAEQVTEWLWREFGDSLPRDFFASIIQHSQTPGQLPLTFVLLDGDELLATVGLWRCDLISRRGSVPVAGGAVCERERARGQGLAGQLQRHVMQQAKAMGFSQLHLYSACRDFLRALRLALHWRCARLPQHHRSSLPHCVVIFTACRPGSAQLTRESAFQWRNHRVAAHQRRVKQVGDIG